MGRSIPLYVFRFNDQGSIISRERIISVFRMGMKISPLPLREGGGSLDPVS